MQKKLILMVAAALMSTVAMAQPDRSGQQNPEEAQRQAFTQGQRQRRNRQQEELMKMDVSKPKTAYMVMNAHLDTQWNWDIQTTISEYIPKTIRQNIHLLRTYPNYICNFEGAIKYAWMKEYFPNEYDEVKKYIAEGRWHLTGTSWDATETIISSSESLFRNTLLGQQFFRNEYGKESTDFFLPDCFGFPYNYPTIAKHCGLIGFSSQKLQWRTSKFYDQKLTKYPFSVGIWEGIDGSKIMMAHGYGYNKSYDDIDLSESRELYREMSESPTGVGYRYYGTGDTGGAATVPSVRSLEKGLKGNGPVKIISAASDQIYKDFMPYESHPELPNFKGELYMDVHGVGCYTSQAAMKLYNRQNEHLADAAERASIVAEWLGQKAYPAKTIRDCWQTVLLHQFHDDLPGTSIPRAYEFSWNDEIINMKRFSDITRNAVSGVAEKLNTQVSGTPIVLYNPESFTQKTVADILIDNNIGSYSVKDDNGKSARSQVVVDTKGRKHLLIEAEVPATGFAVYAIKAGGNKTQQVEKVVNSVENSVYRLTFDQNGNLSSILDKRYNKELVEQGKSVGLIVFTDCKSEAWPAWEILKTTLDGNKVTVNEDVDIKLIENGALRKTVKVTKKYGESEIAQYVRLYEGALADRIDFYNEVEWKSLNSLLKCDFPLSVSNPMATYDLGLGSVERCNNEEFKHEVYSHEWTDLTDKSGDYGVTVINNCKYGWDKPADNELRLSLLWSPQVGRGYTYQNKQDFGHHEFTYSIIGHKGALDKGLAVEQSTQLNSPIRAFEATKHKGELGRQFSFASSDNKNVIIRAFKKAEVSDEYVVRVYENSGKAQKANIRFASAIQNAVEADGTEKTLGATPFDGNTLSVNIEPYSVKTYKLTFAGQKAVNKMPQEDIDLPWNKRCFSTNEFRSAGDFDGGYSYAAELIPNQQITVDGVEFHLQDLDGTNGYACQGDTIALPQGNYNKIYLLAAATKGDLVGIMHFLNKNNRDFHDTAFKLPNYTGFLGQWGHEGQGEGFMKDMKNVDIAYIGTHRHSTSGDEPYEFTYMFRLGFDIPDGATQVVLPKDSRIVVFGMKAVNEPAQVKTASQMFITGNKNDELSTTQVVRPNLLKGAKILAKTGQVNDREAAEMMIDGNPNTKWCDTNVAPNYVAFDLGAQKTITGWRLLSAGSETSSYITRSCMLQVRNSLTEEWKTIDLVDGNKKNDLVRSVEATNAQYVRLFVTGPAQGTGRDATRIYELEVYE